MNTCDHSEWGPACPFCSAPALALFDAQVVAIVDAIPHADRYMSAFAPLIKRYDEIKTADAEAWLAKARANPVCCGCSAELTDAEVTACEPGFDEYCAACNKTASIADCEAAESNAVTPTEEGEI